MRNEAFYGETFFITSPEDIDEVINYIKTDWEKQTFVNESICVATSKPMTEYDCKILILVDVLDFFKDRDITPKIKIEGDSAMIVHYAFIPFSGFEMWKSLVDDKN